MYFEKKSIHILLIGSMIGFLAQSSRAENRFGTEIELHGLGHKAIHLCMKGSVYYVMGVVGYPMWSRYNREEISNLHTIASLGVGTGCFLAYLMDIETHCSNIFTKLSPFGLGSSSLFNQNSMD